VLEENAPPCLNFLTKKAPYKGLGADSEEKREPVSDIDTAVADSLEALDPDRPIREADIATAFADVGAGEKRRISRASAIAVHKLMTNSNFVTCETGISAGFSPLRMRPA
jgi:hypothetical protein